MKCSNALDTLYHLVHLFYDNTDSGHLSIHLIFTVFHESELLILRYSCF